MRGVTPNFVIAFRSPATKLVLTDMDKVKPEDREVGYRSRGYAYIRP